jgi:hypothetical protein
VVPYRSSQSKKIDIIVYKNVSVKNLKLKPTPVFSEKKYRFCISNCNCFLRNQSQKALAINFTDRETKDKYELKGVEHNNIDFASALSINSDRPGNRVEI